MIGVNARDLATFRIDRDGQLEARRAGSARPRRRRGERNRVARAGRRRRARRRRRDPRRLDAHARAGPGREARRAPLAAARQGLRADARGGRGRRGRGGRGHGRLRPRRGEPASRARRFFRCPTPCCPSRWSSARPRATRDLVQLYPREEGKVRGRDAVLLRDGEEVARVVDLPWQEEDPSHLERARGVDGTRDARGRARTRRTSGDAIDSRSPVGRGRELEPRGLAGDQGSRPHPRLRRGCTVTTGHVRGVRRPLRSGDADPRARRARARVGRRRVADPAFREELDRLGERYVGRPSPLYEAERFAPAGRRILLKREDLNHTGAHKINNALGQILLARAARQAAHRRRDRRRASTALRRRRSARVSGSSASCTWAPRTCAGSIRTSSACGCSAPRYAPVEFGTKTLKEATSEAIRDWIANVETTYYLIGSVRRPAPVPEHRA